MQGIHRAIALGLLVLTTMATGQTRVLVYDDTGAGTGFSPPYNEDFYIAAQNLGLNATLATSESAFTSMLAGGNWDMVICDVGNYQNQPTTLDAIQAFLNQNKPVIYGHWQASSYGSHPIFAQEGITIGASLSTPPANVYDWTGTFYTAPNMVPTITNGDPGMYGLEGQLSAVTTASDEAGYTPAPTAGQVGIAIGSSGRFIYNAFIFDPFSLQNNDGDAKPDPIELAENEISFLLGPTCGFTLPMAGATVSGNVDVVFDANDQGMAPLTGGFAWSTDAGMTFNPCTPTMSSPHGNPTSPIPTPATGEMFTWDSIADGLGLMMPVSVVLQLNVFDPIGMTRGECRVTVDVDNVLPPPMCMITAPPGGPHGGDITFDLSLQSPSSPTVGVFIEYSVDGGMNWNPATAAMSSPLTSPAMGVPVGMTQFIWDSRLDNVGVGIPISGILLRATVADGVAILPGECTTAGFDVDNTSLCGGICGDCDLNMSGPNILDALVAAQIAAGLLTPTMPQVGCCDVNSTGQVEILDALLIAQSSAALPVSLMCL